MRPIRRFAMGAMMVGIANLLGCAARPPAEEQQSVMSVKLDSYGPIKSVLGDVVADPSPDLIIAAQINSLNDDEVGIYVSDNRGDYSFGNPVLVATVPIYGGSSGPGMDLTLADIDNDSDLDIVVAAEKPNQNRAAVYVIENRGDNTYEQPVFVGDVRHEGLGGLGISSGDADSDGMSDLVVSAEHPSKDEGHIYLFINQGDGTFKGPAIDSTQANP